MRLMLVCLLLMMSLCGNAADKMAINADKNSQQFVVTLPSNPTTGFQWKVTNYDKTLFKMTESHFIPLKTKLIGAGGQMVFTFTRLKGKSYPHSTQMVFRYARSWEAKGGSVEQVTVNFVATSSKK